MPHYTTLHSLPRPINTSSADTTSPLFTPETPSVYAVPGRNGGQAHLLASSGAGDLVLLRPPSSHDDAAPATLLLESELHLPAGPSAAELPQRTPFIVHSAAQTSCERIEALLTRTIRRQVDIDAPGSSRAGLGASVARASSRTRTETSFEVVCVDVSVPADASAESDKRATSTLNVKWRMASDDLPKLFSAVLEGDRVARWIVAGPSELREPSKAELSVGPAMQEPLPGKVATAEIRNSNSAPPYTWTQTSTSLNLSIDLPSTLNPAQDIVCLLRPHTLDLLVYPRGAPVATSLAHWLDLPGKTGRRDWWDGIRADESTWTFERASEACAFARLEVHLEKANPGTRWPSLFAPYIELDDEETVDEVDVPETISAEEVEATRERLMQYTSEFGQAGLGNDAAASLPGLLREEMEDEDDVPDGMQGSAGAGYGSSAKAGKEILVSYVECGSDGEAKVVTPMKNRVEIALSYSFGAGQMGVIIKAHVDGAVFTLPYATDTSIWHHKSTSPALSFVLSSKRDAQFVYHHAPSGATGATTYVFESRQSSGLGGNLYIYFPVDNTDIGQTASGKSRAKQAHQTVVKFGIAADVEWGSLLGVKLLEVAGRPVVVGLGERAIVLL